MNGGEDRKIIFRGIRKKTVETFLLVLGLALGIGAAAAGIGLAVRSMAASKEELATPQYREIIVTTREDSDEMDTPLLLRDTTKNVVLTSIDFAAAKEAPDVAFAYLKSNENFMNVAMMIQRFQQNAQSGQSGQNAGPDMGGFGPPPEMMEGGQAQDGRQPAQGTQSEGTGTPNTQSAGTGTAPATQSAQGTPSEGESRTTGTGDVNAQTAQSSGRDGETAQNQASGTTDGTSQTAGGTQNGRQNRQPDRGPGFDMSQIDLSGPLPVPEEWYGYLVTPDYFNAWDLHAKEGGLFTVDDIRNNTNPMVLGSELAKTLYEDGKALGRKPIAGRTIYTITGILEPTGTVLDNLAFAPAFMPDVQGNIRQDGFAMFRGRWNSALSFMVSDPDRLEQAAAQLRSYFTRTYGEGSVIITIPREEAQAARDRNARIVTLILFLALTGLFIAGVNVSNTLLSRAIKRQKTVGILKALGASKNRVFSLFFTEAFIIGVLGTIVGTGFSILLSRLIEGTTNLSGTQPLELAAGIVLSWIITTVLIVFPSMQAARVPAAEAMRNE